MANPNIVNTSEEDPNLKVVEVWLLPITKLSTLGMVNILKSTPVLFTKLGLLFPIVGKGNMEELKKFAVEFPA